MVLSLARLSRHLSISCSSVSPNARSASASALPRFAAACPALSRRDFGLRHHHIMFSVCQHLGVTCGSRLYYNNKT
jgi:hypothetical protein